MPFDLAGRRVWVAGHQGMVGAALVRRLRQEPCDILTVPRAALDLTQADAVLDWMQREKPHAVIIAAAKVGGIYANNTYPVDFLRDNLAIQLNVIEAAHRCDVQKLLALGSSCIYPREAPQPMSEEALLTGPLEPTNEWYALAKIVGIKLCEAYRLQHGRDFISAMPTNLYGPGDNFDIELGHVIPGLMHRMHRAKQAAEPEVRIWGSGAPLREFLHVDDLADALVFLLKTYSGAMQINVGSGQEIAIRDLARMIADVVGYRGELVFDTARPDGTPRKLLSVERLHAMGWQANIRLEEGLRQTYDWFLAADPASIRGR